MGSILGSFFGTFFGTLFGHPNRPFYEPVLAKEREARSNFLIEVSKFLNPGFVGKLLASDIGFRHGVSHTSTAHAKKHSNPMAAPTVLDCWDHRCNIVSHVSSSHAFVLRYQLDTYLN